MSQRGIADVARRAGVPITSDEEEVYNEALGMVRQYLQKVQDSPSHYPLVSRVRRDVHCRTDKGDDPLNCFITRFHLEGNSRGPLFGKRVGLKDNISVAGVPLTLGSATMLSFIPDVDATVVTRLLDAGATLVGKLNMDGFSHGAHGLGTGIGDFGRVMNPLRKNHITGGSSSGSAAAVASGAVDFAMGGDQGGSIRIPSAWCGIVGIKPTHGFVPHTGVVGIEPSIDHVGPMARSVEEVAIALDCIAGPDGHDPRQTFGGKGESAKDLHSGVEGVRVGVLREGFGGEGSEADVEQSVLAAVQALRGRGAVVREISIPEHLECGEVLYSLLFLGTALLVVGGHEDLRDDHFQKIFTSALQAGIEAQAVLLPPRVKLSMMLGEVLGREALADCYHRALRARRAYRRVFDDAFCDVDCLAMPTVPLKPPLYRPPTDRREALYRTLIRKAGTIIARNTTPFALTGHPALTIPCGFSEGLPVGLMLVGPYYSDGFLLRVGFELANVLGRSNSGGAARAQP